jgi:biotin carboxyl carrier protein
MRINLEGVRRRREDMIDRIKFGDDYSNTFSGYDRQADFQFTNLLNKRAVKWIWQTALAAVLIISTIFLQQLSSPWAISSLVFIDDVVDRDYNWKGVLEAFSDSDLLNLDSGLLTPTMYSADADLYNEYITKYPNDSITAPVFNPVQTDPNNQQTDNSLPANNDVPANNALLASNMPTFLNLPIEGLLVKKFTVDKPYLEFIALENKNVIAATEGIVQKIGYNDKDELLIHIKNDQITHVYGRLTDVTVREGDTVKAGQLLAKVTATNDVELLLFQIIQGEKAIDPEPMLP